VIAWALVLLLFLTQLNLFVISGPKTELILTKSPFQNTAVHDSARLAVDHPVSDGLILLILTYTAWYLLL